MLCNCIVKNTKFLQYFHKTEKFLSSLAPAYKSCILSNLHKQPSLYINNRSTGNSNTKLNDVNSPEVNVASVFVRFKYLRLMKNAAREFGPFIEINQKLTRIIQNAEKNNLPSELIDFAIKITGEVRANVGIHDLLLSNGRHFVIQYEDIDVTTTKHHLLELCRAYDCTLIPGGGKWPQNFDQKGIISVRCDESGECATAFKEDKLSSIGAEAVFKETDAEGVKYWMFHCDPLLLQEVKGNLQKVTSNIEEAYVGFVPKKTLILPPSIRNSVYDIVLQLSKIRTIDNLFCNVNLLRE